MIRSLRLIAQGISHARMFDIAAESFSRLNEQMKVNHAMMDAMEKMELEHARNTRNLIEKFLYALEAGEDEEALRYGLQEGLNDLNDHVARLEEHAS